MQVIHSSAYTDLAAVKGKKVLHVDRNGYYGGDCASLNLSVRVRSSGAGRRRDPAPTRIPECTCARERMR